MEQHRSTTVFRDRDGRPRALWRVSLAYVGFLVVLLGISIAVAVPLQLLSAPRAVEQAIVAPALALAMLGFVACLRRFVDRRPLREVLPVPDRRSAPQLALGLGLAVAVMGTTAAVSTAAGWARPHPYQLTAPLAGALALQLLFIAVSEALPEETMFRGYLFRNLSAALPLWAAWTTTGILFGALHILSSSGADSLGQQLLYVLMAMGFGLLLTSARVVTGGLWMGMGIHTGVDFLLISPGQGVLGVRAASQVLYGDVLLVTAACLAAAAVGLLLLGLRSRVPALRGRLPDPAQPAIPQPAGE